MKIKRLFLGFASLILGANFLYSFGFDYNIGGGFGFYQTSNITRRMSYDLPLGSALFSNNFAYSEYAWTAGGFLGLGLSFDTRAPMAIGIQYKGEYSQSQEKLKSELYSGGSVVGEAKASLTLHSYQHSLDLYYKVSFNPLSNLPLSLQIMAGMAMMNPFYETYSASNSYTAKSLERKQHYTSGTILGFHTGLRFQIHMFYLGLDYSYLGNYPREFSLEGSNKTPSELLKKNLFTASLGIIINNEIINSFIRS